MATMIEMVQSHLLNVEREIDKLNQQKVAIDGEIIKLKDYLVEANDVLNSEATKAADTPLPSDSETYHPDYEETPPPAPFENVGGRDSAMVREHSRRGR